MPSRVNTLNQIETAIFFKEPKPYGYHTVIVSLSFSDDLVKIRVIWLLGYDS